MLDDFAEIYLKLKEKKQKITLKKIQKELECFVKKPSMSISIYKDIASEFKLFFKELFGK